MDKTVNEKLLEEQKYWVNKTLKEYWCKTILKESNGIICANKNKILSHPFYMGLTDEYIYRPDGKKRIMIVGQEPMGYGSICDGTAKYDFIKSCTAKECEENTNESKNSQQWAKAYLIKQLYEKDVDLPSCYSKKIKNNTSPFWKLFRLLKDEYVLCWNNLDKVYFVETGELTYEAEKKLSECYAKEGEVEKRSLLQREIKLAEPDLVLFVTGPKYNVSMNVAFGLKDELDSVKPSSNKKLIPITDIVKLTSNNKSGYIPAFWTYHPNYLSHYKVLNEIINEIKGVKL